MGASPLHTGKLTFLFVSQAYIQLLTNHILASIYIFIPDCAIWVLSWCFQEWEAIPKNSRFRAVQYRFSVSTFSWVSQHTSNWLKLLVAQYLYIEKKLSTLKTFWRHGKSCITSLQRAKPSLHKWYNRRMLYFRHLQINQKLYQLYLTQLFLHNYSEKPLVNSPSPFGNWQKFYVPDSY